MSAFIFWSVQKTAGILSFIVGAIIVWIVIFLVLSTVKENKKDSKDKVYGVRKKYFRALLIIAALVLSITIGSAPYAPLPEDTESKVVGIVALQWLWRMEEGELPEDPSTFMGEDEITLPAWEPIEFEVTSLDVNHGFGIYTAKGDLIAQSQAMPGRVNRFHFVFEPGVYSILCMEYCGLPHGIMIGKIIVK